MTRQSGSNHADRDIVDLVQELVVGMANTGIYWADHPSVKAPVDELVELLPKILARMKKKSLVLGTVKNHLVVEERALLGASMSAPRLIRAILERASGGVEFDRDTTEDEFKNFLTVISQKVKPGENTDTVNRELTDFACKHIRLLPPYDDKQRVLDFGGAAHATSLEAATQLYQGLVDSLQGASQVVGDGGRIAFDRIQTIMERVLKIMASDPGQMHQLAGYENYDAYTFGHSVRVSMLALDLAASLTSDKDLLNRIGVAALLHDVGKVRLPHDILHCKGELNKDQRKEMQRHPQYGAEILLDHEESDPMACSVAFGHHRGVNLNGYPRMMQKVDLSLITRVVEICDVFEALTAVRPYRPAMTPVRAFRKMLSMKGKFDPAMLARFIRVHGVYPNGSGVRTTTGELARVMRQTGDPTKPLIKFETDSEGFKLEHEDQPELDLSKPSDDPVQIAQLVTSGIA